jgi:hypothetical protein
METIPRHLTYSSNSESTFAERFREKGSPPLLSTIATSAVPAGSLARCSPSGASARTIVPSSAGQWNSPTSTRVRSPGAVFGREPIYIPGHGRPSDLSVGVTPDGPFSEKLMTPKDGRRWHDRVATRSLLSLSWRRPVRRTGGHYDVYEGGAGFADVL